MSKRSPAAQVRSIHENGYPAAAPITGAGATPAAADLSTSQHPALMKLARLLGRQAAREHLQAQGTGHGA